MTEENGSIKPSEVLRWLKTDAGLILQQQWVVYNAFGEPVRFLWRDVPTVTEDEA